MAKKFELTESDIEDMFEKDDTKVLDDNPGEDLVPNELLIDALKSKVERPKDTESSVIDDYHQQKKEEKEIRKQLTENKLPERLIQTPTITVMNALAKFKKDAYDKDRRRNQANQLILSGTSKLNFSNRNECRHHLFQPAYILQDIVHASCKFCSSRQMFTLPEWKSYQLQNKDII